ncbi:NAD(P)-dependent dehydrogenase, short-chain alcohol dehydrogenase family [Formivibrio citricus]|uniref:NAD(P)-dependent dehydrogenase, short-chain alcohol dehydrogenase family n=1 Tax=Formivibrio citricus TaxID=83765 RepID=A0A1I4XWF2_9NEIS|nr:SDR family oxidoreductase [Formivibrio citricus]SFN30105.1 NAD(P)-dependent dehydrogenase, short-chain alcohol dehydrogenase family [Formivibrio citricus]
MATLNDLMRMNGRRALITGAAGSLGCVIADTLAELGADLVLVDRPGADLAGLATTLADKWDIQVQTESCDLESQDNRDRLIGAALKDNARLDVLVNNAAFVGTSGLQGWALPFEQQTVETWRRAMEVNVTAAFDLCKQFAVSMRQSPHASIINIGSIYGQYGPNWQLYEGTAMANPAAYAASKGALIQLTRWLATTLAPSVRVNCISPGGIARGQPESFVARYEAQTPLARMAVEDDFRGAVAYLASDLSRYVTGQNLAVDGGWGVW